MHPSVELLLSVTDRSDVDVEMLLNTNESMLIMAPPGCGKTKLLIARALWRRQFYTKPPRGLAFLTYSRALARTLEQTVFSAGLGHSPNLFIGTLHSFCLSQLAGQFSPFVPRPIRIASHQQSREAFDKALNTTGIRSLKWEEFSAYRNSTYLDRRLGLYNAATNRKHIDLCIGSYEKTLYVSGCVDFDMLVRESLRLVKVSKAVRDILEAAYPEFLIDEYQDLGYALHRFVKLLLQTTTITVFAVSDPNQCIYQFQGADVAHTREIATLMKTVELKQDFRHAKVIACAGAAINPGISQTLLRSDQGYVTLVKCTSKSIGETLYRQVRKLLDQGIRGDDILILSRAKKEILEISGALLSIPHRILRHPMYECGTELVNWIELASAWSTEDESTRRLISDQVVKDFIRIWECDGNTLDELESLRLRIDLFDVLSSISATGQLFSEWLAIIEERLLTPELQEKLNMWRPDDVDELNSLKKLLSRGQQLSGLLVQKFGSYVRRGEIRITTCHSSKGLQAEHVFIWRSSFGDLTAECDKNLLYTAITRAGTGLVVMYQQNSRYIDILSSICNVNA